MYKYISLLLTSLLLIFLLPTNAKADWAHAFVVWDGYSYILTDEYIEEVDQEIGHVTKYSDREGTYSGNFSNVYEKGTKYFSIIGADTNEKIAVQVDGDRYRIATMNEEYAGKPSINSMLLAAIVIGIFLILIIFLLESKLKKQK